MKVFFVSGVDTNVGKTFVTQNIIQSLHQRGLKAIAIKPIETGVVGLPCDAMIHLENSQKIFPNLKLSDVNLYSFEIPCAPYIADQNQIIQINAIYNQIRRFENDVDILIVEGAGGLFVPIKKDFFMITLAQELQKYFDTQTLVVCDDALGMINRFLSAKFILDSLKLRYLFFVNIRNPSLFKEINLPFMQDFDFETCIEILVERFLKE